MSLRLIQLEEKVWAIREPLVSLSTIQQINTAAICKPRTKPTKKV